MKLSECNMGQIVMISKTSIMSAFGDIGHIVGLTKNSTGGTIPVVLWAGKSIPEAIHQCNLTMKGIDK
jgi:hypothetical protein